MSKRLKLETLKVSIDSLKNKPTTINYFDSETSRFFETNEIDVKKKNDSNQLHIQAGETGTASKKSQNKKNVNIDNTKNVHKELSDWYPVNWEHHLNNIKFMRQNHTAPVDEMGCTKCADESADGPTYRFQVLLALMLSTQTKDQTTYSAMLRLREFNCTPARIASISDDELGKMIYPVSFWKRKIQYLKKTSMILLQKYDGDIPNNVKDLCKLPGVGPKIAHICMQTAWNKLSGIGVDTHVHKISNRLKWVPEPTKTPEETRMVLESWLPKELWKDINYLFVGFGQEICQSQRPKCSECLNKTMCPYAANEYQF